MHDTQTNTNVAHPLAGEANTIGPYSPNELLDFLRRRAGLKNDTALALELGVWQSVISRIRSMDRMITPEILLRAHDRFGLPIQQIRELAGIPPYRQPKG